MARWVGRGFARVGGRQKAIENGICPCRQPNRANSSLSLRMDSPDALDIPATAPITQQAVAPAFPSNSSSTANSLPRSPNRPPVPLSIFERLPTEIHIEILKIIDDFGTTKVPSKELCGLAWTSPLFTQPAQELLYRHISLSTEGQAREWMESDATVRGEFATRAWDLDNEEEGQPLDAETVETVLAMQTSGLDWLHLSNVESVKSSALSAFTSQSPAVIREADADGTLLDLLILSLDDSEIKMDDSPDKPNFRLHDLTIVSSTVPSSYLSDVMASSSTSLRIVHIYTEVNLDWNPITSTTLPQLRTLHLTGPHIPSLHNLLSGCENLKELRLYRYNEDPAISDATIPQLSKELASLPNPTLKRCRLLLCYVGRSGGVITLQEVEDLIALPSLENLENLRLSVPKTASSMMDLESLRANKGKKGKLVVAVDVVTW